MAKKLTKSRRNIYFSSSPFHFLAHLILLLLWPMLLFSMSLPDGGPSLLEMQIPSPSSSRPKQTLEHAYRQQYQQPESFSTEISNEDQQYEHEDEQQQIGNSAGVYDTNLEYNMTRVLNALIASHDRRIRPDFGGAPTIVNVTAHVITISAISEVSMDYTVDLYLRQFWHDRRLAFTAFKGHNNLTVGIDMVKSIWTPDTFFPNEKKSYFHETTSHNSFLRIDSNGNVIRSIRLTVTANCPMSLHTFPLDVQVCSLEIESYGYSTSDIIYHWHPNKPVTIDDDVHLAHFSIGGHYQIERTISLSTGNYSRLTAYFTFKRNLGFYLIQIYFPSSLIVVISWVSFFLNREATQARVTIGVTTVLTQTTLMTSTNASLPKVSYVKSLDIFLGVCFFIVFASLLEYATVGFLMKRRRQKSSSTSSSVMPRSSTVCFRELEDGTLKMLAPIHHNPHQQRMPPERKPALGRQASATPPARKMSTILAANGGTELTTPSAGGVPLFNLHPHTAFVPVVTTTGCHNSGLAGGASRGSLAFFGGPDDAALMLTIRGSTDDGTSAAGAAAQRRAGGCCKVRPSQVDLFSRIAFPLFFVIFHLAYWSFHLAYLKFDNI
ncbi:hypothetical protein niasHT_039469 [Heterodera trifolii]|uniref:Gamma-aminobutyric acid receptor subunit beta n=1 Tax=Heterodera trifolii TaxID=157864 RepID=A0ABD2HSU4_9BILA